MGREAAERPSPEAGGEGTLGSCQCKEDTTTLRPKELSTGKDEKRAKGPKRSSRGGEEAIQESGDLGAKCGKCYKGGRINCVKDR